MTASSSFPAGEKRITYYIFVNGCCYRAATIKYEWVLVVYIAVRALMECIVHTTTTPSVLVGTLPLYKLG